LALPLLRRLVKKTDTMSAKKASISLDSRDHI
jgi:hypothetical protein